MLEYTIRVPNFADFPPKIHEFSVFSNFVDSIKNDRPDETILLRVVELKELVPPYFWNKDMVYLRFVNLKNPWLNGWIRGSKSQIQRFNDEFKKQVYMKEKEVLNLHNKINNTIYIVEKDLMGLVEYASPHDPNPVIIKDLKAHKSISFNTLTGLTILKEI